ncbi:hypothetical protein BGL_2c00850 [Burkholderia plantarii]|uniref:Uncharacterized protein n=1 Tax=Burkholderia plantarii TaxID=41899 RepID=A0A0B6RXQ7_BURPL|nr:hypothetical protein BGL_2c00850 [Burkholderia plantarii]
MLIDPAHAGARESRAAELRRWRHDARRGLTGTQAGSIAEDSPLPTAGPAARRDRHAGVERACSRPACPPPASGVG